jgi:hypothetical protein
VNEIFSQAGSLRLVTAQTRTRRERSLSESGFPIAPAQLMKAPLTSPSFDWMT